MGGGGECTFYNRAWFSLIYVHVTLTFLTGFQVEEEEGSGATGAPSLNMQHVSLGTSGRYFAMISAVSAARIKVEQTSLVYLRFKSLSL